jgi:hypothetical protein
LNKAEGEIVGKQWRKKRKRRKKKEEEVDKHEKDEEEYRKNVITKNCITLEL